MMSMGKGETVGIIGADYKMLGAAGPTPGPTPDLNTRSHTGSDNRSQHQVSHRGEIKTDMVSVSSLLLRLTLIANCGPMV